MKASDVPLGGMHDVNYLGGPRQVLPLPWQGEATAKIEPSAPIWALNKPNSTKN